jgi:triphosphoribosyl-dephospho-CoA synthase
MLFVSTTSIKEKAAAKLAAFAVASLLEEVRLTPKPGLVDSHDNGSHHDLTLQLMETSALSLEETFFEMAMASFEKQPTRHLRERLAAIGRYGEQQMLAATGQVNTHKGAIWVLGLLTGATAIQLTRTVDISSILTTAGSIARFEDSYQPKTTTNGDRVRRLFRVRSAREEAAAGFPSLQRTALPAWTTFANEPEPIRRLNVLLALMSVVDDTCILHRSNMEVLKQIQRQAEAIINDGGMGIKANGETYQKLDRFITHHWVSPGGSADLLAATIFLHKIINQYKIN